MPQRERGYLVLIDTHCHLDFSHFDADREAAIERALKAGVGTFINVASSFPAAQEAFKLASAYDCIFSSVGVHPHYAKDCDATTLKQAKALCGEPKVVAVGEVGLDYYRNLSAPDIQIKVFASFIQIAKDASLPLIVHSRQAQEATLAVLKEAGLSGLKGVVIHCFSGDKKFLTACLDAGFFVSFTCNITYEKARDLREVVSCVPLDRIFLETDAPFLAPVSKRGKRNEPAYLVELAEEVARIKGISLEEVCHQTTENAVRFFNLRALKTPML